MATRATRSAAFDAANRDLMETNRFVQRVMSLLMPAMMFGMNLLSVLIVWVGGHAIAQSTLQIGDMMAFIQYAMQIIMAFLMLAMIFILVPRASVSAGRILEVLDAPLSIQDPEKPEVLEEPKGVVEFQDVSFRYHNAERRRAGAHLLYRQARGDHGLYRRHRRGQVHLGEPDSPVLRRDRGRRHH